MHHLYPERLTKLHLLYLTIVGPEKIAEKKKLSGFELATSRSGMQYLVYSITRQLVIAWRMAGHYNTFGLVPRRLGTMSSASGHGDEFRLGGEL